MIEIFETCQTKSITKQTNRDESLIIRSIGYVHKYGYVHMCTGMGVLYTLVYLSTGDIWPNSDSLPQPVTQPVRPIRELPLEGRQIGIMFG